MTEIHENRTKRIHIRCTTEEKETIKNKSKAMGYKSMSEFMRVRATTPVIYIKNNKPYQNVVPKINHIGQNVNHISKRVNTSGEVTLKDIDHLKKEIGELSKIIHKLEEDFEEDDLFIHLKLD